MTGEFMREERYIVFKVSDLGNSLKGDEIRRLAREYAEQRRLKGKKPLECVVVEKDWPEHEPTWKAIEARVSGAQLAPNAVAYLDLGVGGYMDVGTDLTDEELATLPKGRHMLGVIGTYGVDGYAPAQPAPSVPADTFEIIRGLVREIERNTCTHEETHRGGFLWEICDSCGAKWADDEGGKPEFKWPKVVEKARDMLAKAQGAKP